MSLFYDGVIHEKGTPDEVLKNPQQERTKGFLAGFVDGFEHRLGYSIGIGFPPDWGEGRIMSINENDPLVLEPGMCFHYIPDCKFPYQGGVVFSECLAVTETGYELLSDFASEIFYK